MTLVEISYYHDSYNDYFSLVISCTCVSFIIRYSTFRRRLLSLFSDLVLTHYKSCIHFDVQVIPGLG